MNTNVKKLMSTISAFTLSVGMTISITANASTNDTSWNSGNNYIRDKDTSSSIYIKNSSDYYYSYVTVYGRNSGGNIDYAVNSHPITGQTVNTYNVTIPARSERAIRQFVYERGYPLVNAIFSGSGYGWWSPDSYGTYTPAN